MPTANSGGRLFWGLALRVEPRRGNLKRRSGLADAALLRFSGLVVCDFAGTHTMSHRVVSLVQS